jgi:hypothetical protein
MPCLPRASVARPGSRTGNWKNGHPARVLYQTEKITTVGTINVPISQPGTYYLAFNNQFSILSDKTITGYIQLQHLAARPTRAHAASI